MTRPASEMTREEIEETAGSLADDLRRILARFEGVADEPATPAPSVIEHQPAPRSTLELVSRAWITWAGIVIIFGVALLALTR